MIELYGLDLLCFLLLELLSERASVCSFAWKGMSWNSMIGKYMVFTTDVDITRRALSQNDQDTLLMAVSFT